MVSENRRKKGRKSEGSVSSRGEEVSATASPFSFFAPLSRTSDLHWDPSGDGRWPAEKLLTSS